MLFRSAVTPLERQYAASVGVPLPANPDAVYPGFSVQGGANSQTVAQALKPFPQYGIINSRLQSEGYTVNIDRVGTAPLDQCVVTSVRNPQQVTQWVPYNGPGRNGDRVLIQVVTSQSISVTLNCSR